MLTNGTLTHRFDEKSRPGMRLGRHLELDARSLEYTIEKVTRRAPIKPAENLPAIPTLDQGNVGSCTGNAATYHLSALYGAADLPTLAGKTLGSDAALDEQFAVEVYHEATVKDGFRGTYPPDDTGSSGLGVCRALKAAKLISGYAWATTERGFATLLQRAGVMMGIAWYEAFFEPDSDGFIDAADWKASGIAGGHEVYVEALESWQELSSAQSVVRFHNSWGAGWGDHGCGRMRLSTYLALRHEIDIKQGKR